MQPPTDLPAVHRYFAAQCFNDAWDLIDKPDRTPAEDRRMVALCHASIFHWLNREDCRDQHLSIGYWQASRVEAVLGNAGEARRWAEVSLEYSRELAPFYLGYAHEALARAAMMAGKCDEADQSLAQARALASRVEEDAEREALLGDLSQVEQLRPV